MIVFSQLGRKGNLGNQLFQIASTIGIAKKNNQEYFFPDWKYSKYFKRKLPLLNEVLDFMIIKEKSFHYHEWNIENKDYDISGWLQSEKYFDINATKDYFLFDDELIYGLLIKNRALFDKKTILVSVRRGDFVNNPYYFQLSFRFYFLAIIKNFPDWKNKNLIFVSDDISYCKYHFSFLKNAFFLNNLSDIEQMALGSQCDDFVISNSTFSWWIAWLGEKENSKIIRPPRNFRGQFSMQNDDSDYFPLRWISFNDKLFSMEKKYFILNMKGNVYSLFVNLKFSYLSFKKNMKTFVKRICVSLRLHKNI